MDETSGLDRYCGSEFWNLTLTWNTDDPDFTKCFEKTVLVWIPCVFLWLFGTVDVYFILSSKYKDIPWNWINTSKLIIAGVLCALSVCDLGVNLANKSAEEQIYDVDIYSPAFKILTFALVLLLVFFCRKHGVRTSGLQFTFCFLLAVCGIPQLRTEIYRVQKKGVPESNYEYRSYLIYYPLVVLMFLLNCFADKAPREANYLKTEKLSPELGASFLSRILFTWYDPMMFKGFRRPLVVDDLYEMKPEDSAQEVIPLFDKKWQEAVAKCESSNYSTLNGHPRASFKSNSGKVDFTKSTKKSKKKQASIVPVLINVFGPALIMGAIFKLVCDVLAFASPQILGLLITFAKSGEYAWRGYFYAALLFAAATVQTLFLSQYSYVVAVVGMRIRTCLVATIYEKALKISNATRKERTVGEIVNLMAMDAQRFMDLSIHINALWSCPLQICLAMYFLWQELGPSVLAGLVVMILLIPLNAYIANKVKTYHIKQMKRKDERVKLMNEILSGIKVLKLYAWEPSFENHILNIRNKEVKVLKAASYLHAATTFIWSCAPFFVSLVSFATYVLIDEKNVLDANKAYVSISLFNILRGPLMMLPMTITTIIQAWVSVKRINAFMNSEELDPNTVSHDPSEDDAVVIEDGTFAWEEEPILTNINIRLPTNSLTAVVGTVGSGKSSFISACLGEMEKLSGRVNTIGSIAYASQQAWLQNATLQENIIFGKKYDKILYEKIIEACALKPDFAMLPAGDQTEVGEKGINLSGGQKQRVSLARAVYSNADLYFLDDPLSAVDAHVGKHIFEQVLGPKGLLRHKTRVLVTHGITYLPQTDEILVMKDGKVSESGSYQELLNKKGAFSEFLMQHIQEGVENPEELDELENQLAGSMVSEEITKVIVRQRSRVSESLSETGSNGLLRQMSSAESVRSLKKQFSSTQSIKNGIAKPKRTGRLIEIERAETGNVSWDVYKHYLKAIGFIIFLVVTLLNTCFQAFGIGTNVWLGIWSEDEQLVVNGTVNTGKRDMYLAVYGVLGVGQALSTMGANLVFTKGSIDAAVKLHNYVLRNVLRLPMSFFDVTPSGRILGRFSNDINGVDLRLPMNFNILLSNSIKIIGTLAVISYSTPLFMAVILPIGILYYIIQRFYIATSRQLKRIESISKSPIYSHFGETLTGVQIIRAYKQQERFIHDSENKIDTNQICFYPIIVTNRWVAVRLEMIANLVILFAATFAVLSKDTMPAMVGLSVTYSLQITQTLNFLVRMISDVENNMVAVERIKEYGEAPCEAPWEIPNKTPAVTWPENGSVNFKNYAVRYRPGLELVLKGVNFDVRGGEKVGIVGRTGAGKSSLTLALFRIIEAADGQIDMDGVNISEIGLHSLRSRLTIIPQDAVLFSGSLRMNLDPFDKHTDEELWTCLENAHLKEFVKGLPAGLHHEVTEGGDNLSVGQRQLICLGRALLRKTKVLVLDEATAAVDLETDDLIQRTIRSEFKDGTVLTIAHRLNTIMDSDRVIVLDQGQIAEFDTPANLLNRPESIFYSMCKDAGLT